MKKFVCILAALILSASLGGKVIKNEKTVTPEAGELCAYFLDVGQADSAFVVFPDGSNMLIDAGNEIDGNSVADFITDMKINKIDRVVCTHPHADHIGGMDVVLERIEANEIFMPDAVNNTKQFEELLDVIAEKNLEIDTVSEPRTIIDDGSLTVSFLSPQDKEYDDLNEYSIVTRITYKNNSIIIMGDASKENESDILAKAEYNLDSDVLRVGHHGSKTASSDEFLDAVTPEMAIISVGADNDYGHPSDEVLKRLNKHGIKVLRTDEDGTITVKSDGESITYETSGDKK